MGSLDIKLLIYIRYYLVILYIDWFIMKLLKLIWCFCLSVFLYSSISHWVTASVDDDKVFPELWYEGTKWPSVSDRYDPNANRYDPNTKDYELLKIIRTIIEQDTCTNLLKVNDIINSKWDPINLLGRKDFFISYIRQSIDFKCISPEKWKFKANRWFMPRTWYHWDL